MNVGIGTYISRLLFFCGWGVKMATRLHPTLKKERIHSSTFPYVFVACTSIALSWSLKLLVPWPWVIPLPVPLRRPVHQLLEGKSLFVSFIVSQLVSKFTILPVKYTQTHVESHKYMLNDFNISVTLFGSKLSSGSLLLVCKSLHTYSVNCEKMIAHVVTHTRQKGVNL
jgi:hypothetical protein